MRALPNLIRLHRWQLDERRRAVADLEVLRLTICQDIDRLEVEIAEESGASRELTEGVALFPSYFANARARRTRMEASIEEIDASLDAAREEAAKAYRELRKYETALENSQRQEELADNRREQAEQNEVGLGIFRRRVNS
jgi:flagellar biosynthesis chaperone FliJ